jgi:hypothetical protein
MLPLQAVISHLGFKYDLRRTDGAVLILLSRDNKAKGIWQER